MMTVVEAIIILQDMMNLMQDKLDKKSDVVADEPTDEVGSVVERWWT